MHINHNNCQSGTQTERISDDQYFILCEYTEGIMVPTHETKVWDNEDRNIRPNNWFNELQFDSADSDFFQWWSQGSRPSVVRFFSLFSSHLKISIVLPFSVQRSWSPRVLYFIDLVLPWFTANIRCKISFAGKGLDLFLLPCYTKHSDRFQIQPPRDHIIIIWFEDYWFKELLKW